MTLKASSLRSKCQHDWFLLRWVRKNQFHITLPASGGSRVIFGVLWLWMHHSDLCSLWSMFTLCVRLSFHMEFFYKDTSPIGFEIYPTQRRPRISLTNYICNNPTSWIGSYPELLGASKTQRYEFCGDIINLYILHIQNKFQKY